MAKLLVDTQTDEIRGYYDDPLDFSVSGRYVLDVPPGLYPTSTSVTTAITDKVNRYKAYHPSLVNSVYDELLSTPNIDILNSSGYFLGPNKRTEVYGYIYTNPIAFTIVPAPTKALIHLHGFTLYSDPGVTSINPPPNRLLYNYDPSTGFFTFNPSVFQVEIVDAVSFVPLYPFLAADTEEDVSAVVFPASVRLRFTNTGVIRYHLSDWLLLYG